MTIKTRQSDSIIVTGNHFTVSPQHQIHNYQLFIKQLKGRRDCVNLEIRSTWWKLKTIEKDLLLTNLNWKIKSFLCLCTDKITQLLTSKNLY
jgi:hypothetical protein